MKLLTAIREPHQAETPAKSRESMAPDRAGDSGRGFGDVLAKVKSKKTQTPPERPPSRGTDAAAPNDPVQKAAKIGDAGIITGLPSGTSGRPGNGDGSVDKLLKRLKSKHEDAPSDANADPKLPSTDPAVLPVLVTNLSAGPPTEGRNDPKIVDGLLSAKGQTAETHGDAEPGRSGAATQQDGEAVLGVSVSAHIAPAKTDDIRRQPPDDDPSKPVQRLDEHATMIASNGDGSSGQDDKPGRGKSDLAGQSKVEEPGATGAPVAIQAPIRGIATAVAKLAAQAPAAGSGVPEASKPVGTAPARTVILQMSPANLGVVEIRLHLSGQALDVHLTISEQRTAGLIARERETLAKALEDHSYQLNSLVVQNASLAASSEGSHVANHETSDGTRPENQSGSRDGHGSEARGGGSKGENREQPTRGDIQPRSNSASRARASGGRSLFI